jgi:hypothetical protein
MEADFAAGSAPNTASHPDHLIVFRVLVVSALSKGHAAFMLSVRSFPEEFAGSSTWIGSAEAQGGEGLQASTPSRLNFAAAKEPYLSQRETRVSPSTMKLERYALGQLSKHFDSISLASLTIGHIAEYVKVRKTAGVGNRSINIELGALRRLMKQFRLWGRIGDEYRPLPEHPEGERRHGEEVHCGNRFPVVIQKDSPTLRRFWTSWNFPHPAQHSSLRDIETEHPQLAMNPWRSPGRVLGHHAED